MSSVFTKRGSKVEPDGINENTKGATLGDVIEKINTPSAIGRGPMNAF
jgi:hypothetical protein